MSDTESMSSVIGRQQGEGTLPTLVVPKPYDSEAAVRRGQKAARTLTRLEPSPTIQKLTPLHRLNKVKTEQKMVSEFKSAIKSGAASFEPQDKSSTLSPGEYLLQQATAWAQKNKEMSSIDNVDDDDVTKSFIQKRGGKSLNRGKKHKKKRSSIKRKNKRSSKRRKHYLTKRKRRKTKRRRSYRR